jgi:signal transduction histidine kinase
MATGRVWRSRSLDLALVLLGVVSLVLVFVVVALTVDSGNGPLWALLLVNAVAVEYLVVGLLGWRRRPHNRLGPIIVVGAIAILLSALGNVATPSLVAVGIVFATLPLGMIVHLLLAFPSGRLQTRSSVVIVVGAYVVCLLLQAPLYLFAADGPVPGDPLAIADRPDLVGIGQTVQSLCGALVMVATTVVLVGRLREATPRQRRVLAPLDAYGIVAILCVPVSSIMRSTMNLDANLITLLQIVLLAGVPLAFTWSIQRGGFAPAGEIDALAVRLGAEAAAGSSVDLALAQTLGDPSLQVIYAVADGRPVDGAGRPFDIENPGPRRLAAAVHIGARPVAWIVYDATLIADPGYVESAGQVAALALERERLTAELMVRSRELEQSRARIIETGDDERRRIAQDLHDGLQSQLVLLALRAGLLTEVDGASPEVVRRATQLRRELDTAAAELRRLVHGLMPALLVERGLYAATEDLVALTPLPTDLMLEGSDAGLPDTVKSAAYFVVAEGLANALKHSGAGRMSVGLNRFNGTLRIEISDNGIGGAVAMGGAGLRGLADRIDGLGGRLLIDSPPAQGTRLMAEVPCAR